MSAPPQCTDDETSCEDDEPSLGNALVKLLDAGSDQHQYQQGICQVCAIKESQCQEIKQCSGCNVSTYCSRSCQRVDWVTHKPLCRNMSDLSKLDTLHIHSTDLLNLEALINYASTNMPNLKHVYLWIHSSHKVRDEDCNSYEIKEADEVVQLSPETMSSFLESHKGTLTSFNWDTFDVCECERCVRRVTNKGKLFLNLVDLEILRLDTVQFDKITTLQTVIHQSHKTLLRLSLDYMAVGVETSIGDRWTRSDAASLAKAISSCKNLVNLSLAGNSLNPSDMKLMLVNGLPHLRVLDLSGLCDVGGQLNDKSCSIIASKLPKLHELQLLHQSKITFSGLQAIMRRCRDLKSLNTSVQLKRKELKRLVESFPKIMSLGIANEDQLSLYDFELAAIVEGLGGRMAIYNYDEDDYLDVTSNLSSEAALQNRKVIGILEADNDETKRNYCHDNTNINLWEDR